MKGPYILWHHEPEADQYWREKAACRRVDPETFFPLDGDSLGQEAAKAICMGCEVRSTCLEEAMDHRELEGVRGGTTGQERRRMFRRGRVPA